VPVSSVSASNFVFDHTPTLSNAGTMTIDDGAALPLSGIINNTGTIALDSIGNDTHLELIQHGITLKGGGQLILSDSGENFISGTIPSITLTNEDNTISGAGQLGAAQMTLVNDGMIVATGSHPLVIDTGANVVISVGTLEATGRGGLIVNSDVANTGLIWADDGNVTIDGAVTGSGSAMINGTATLEFRATSSNDVTFAANAAGTLTLDHSLTQPFSAVISGLGADDTIDLKDFAFTDCDMAVLTSLLENGSTTLLVSNTSTQQSVTLTLAGDYTHSTWDFAQDSATGTIVHDLPPPNLNLPGSASADLALTLAAALTIGDQFAFQGDSQSGTLAIDSTSIAPGKDASATDAMTLDTTASSSSDNQSTAAATTNGSADSGLTSSVAANSQPAIGASISNSTQIATMPQTASASPAAMGPHGSDTFVFAANCGHETIPNFQPYADVIEIDHTVFADVQALLAAAHDDGNGSAVIEDVTVAQLVQHQGDFYFT
jgi:hypothetical protein